MSTVAVNTDARLRHDLEQAGAKIEHLENIVADLSQLNNLNNEINILLKKTMIGKKIIKQAKNRQHLKYLVKEILPRRKAALSYILKQRMPKGVQDIFVKKQFKLITSTINQIDSCKQHEIESMQFMLKASKHLSF